MLDSLRKYAAEFLGTFTLVFVGTSVATLQGFLPGYGDNGWLGISLAFGGTLAVLVCVIGPVSGCHLNPAVTIPIAISGRLPWKLAPGYIICQCLGAIAASAVLLALLNGIPGYTLAENGLGANGNPQNIAIATLFLWEVILTGLFVFTILAATREGVPHIVTAVAIGGFLFVAHLIGVPFGDSSLNPARSLGPALIQCSAALDILWLYLAAPMLGGLAGWVAYRGLHDQ